jgi:hypothetical protein
LISRAFRMARIRAQLFRPSRIDSIEVRIDLFQCPQHLIERVIFQQQHDNVLDRIGG